MFTNGGKMQRGNGRGPFERDGASQLQKVRANASRNYIALKALKEHYGLEWSEIRKITKDWKIAHPLQPKEQQDRGPNGNR